jgi:HlyD family secretion protein
MKKTKFLRTAFTIALLTVGTTLTPVVSHMAIAQETQTAAAAPPSITVLNASKKQIAATLSVTGSFDAGALVMMLPEVEGLAVVELLAEEGDTVKKGQVLARLSSAEVEIQLMQNRASLAKNDAAIAQEENRIKQAQISEARALADLNRTKKLRTSGVSTVEQFDQRQADYDLALSQLEAAKLALEAAKADRLAIDAQKAELELRKSRTEIKAPVDGYISRRAVQYGMIASAQRDPLFNLVALGVLKLVAEVPESDLPKVKLGQKAKIAVNGMAKPIEGEVSLISPEVNETTRIGLVHIRVSEGTRVPLGSFGRAEISLGDSDGVTLPLTAVTFGEDGPTIQVVKDGKVEERRVITGLVSTTEIEITDGLAEGEQVVARAGSFVRNGDAVTPVVVSSSN